jgi:hypothetical protein
MDWVKDIELGGYIGYERDMLCITRSDGSWEIRDADDDTVIKNGQSKDLFQAQSSVALVLAGKEKTSDELVLPKVDATAFRERYQTTSAPASPRIKLRHLAIVILAILTATLLLLHTLPFKFAIIYIPAIAIVFFDLAYNKARLTLYFIYAAVSIPLALFKTSIAPPNFKKGK